MARRLALILFVLVNFLPLINPPVAPVAIASAPLTNSIAPPPLPRSCIGGGTPLDYAQPICCVSGYVYLNDVPLAGAAVTISIGGHTLNTQTQVYPGSPLPYFSVSLVAGSLNVQPGDAGTISASASASGQRKSVSFTAQEGGQQIDVALPQIALDATWTPGEQPLPEIRSAAMAYDAARGRMILFGGLAQQGGIGVPLDKTWEWDGTSWMRRTPVNAPPARSGHALAYDTARQRIVLFGGTDASGAVLTDTWEWDGVSWLEYLPAAIPAISGQPTLVYDSLRARVLLIGANASAPSQLATWVWDGTGWTQIPTSIPSARTGFSLAYDAGRDRVVLFGGLRAGVLQQDTWEFNGTAWARTYPLNPPTARSGHAMIYDALRQRVVLVGGVDATGKPLEDSYTYDGSIWAALDVDLPPRANALLAYDSARSLVILAGGYSDAAATTYPNETWELDAVDWNQRAPRASPTRPENYPMVYNASRQRILLFVGFGHNDTWEWDGISWTPRTPPATPSFARGGFNLAYDQARKQVVLFGGEPLLGSPSNDTWAWDGHTWTQLHPAVAPSIRDNAEMVYDTVRQRIVLFGGVVSAGVYLSDTWEWDGNIWTELHPALSPPSLPRRAMAYDATRGRTVLLVESEAYTWEWDGGSWTKSATQIPAPLSGYGERQLGYDAVSQRVIEFGGWSYSAGVYVSDTWQWDGQQWTRLTPPASPPGRLGHKLVSDSTRQRIVLFGGFGFVSANTEGDFNDTWTWNGTTWHEQIDDSYVPGQLSAAAMDDTHDGFSLLFGGRKPDASLSGRTFHWQGNRWLQLDPVTIPPPRQSHQIARNVDGSLLLMFGGAGVGGGYLDDTWLWNGTDWRLQAPASRPTARADYSLTYDTRRNVWVLFGGQSSSYLGDTWEYDGSAWRQVSPSGAPPARAGATLTYDQSRRVAVLVGGQNAGGLLGDVWEYDGSAWTNVTPAQPLVARTGHGAAYDPSRGVVVVTGGLDDVGVRGDTWEWNGAFWRERIAKTPLIARYRMAVAYDTARGELVAFGGEDDTGTIFADTQIHQASGSLSVPIPVATISRITPRDARQGVDTISFEGRGADTDSTDVIAAYRWTHNGNVISDQPTFTLPASALPLSEQVIRFAVQDNEGDWSHPIEQRIYIRDGNAAISTGAKTWTLLIYAVADNNLDPYMGESATFNAMLYRMRNAGAQANVQVGILYDGPGVNDTRRYILQADGQWRTETLSEARMDEMATLRDFVRWGYATFQSDYYALSLVDHANGVVGFGQDNTTDSTGKAFLTPIELRTALQQATDSGVRKLDVLHVDGCSFGLLEDAAIAADLAQYMIVSPNTGWGVFAYDPYRQIAGRATDPRDYAHNVAQAYASAVRAWGRPYTVAVFDMARFAELNRRVSDLGDQLLAYTLAVPATRVEQLRGLRNTSQKYDSGGVYLEIDPEDSYVDLVDFARQAQASVRDANVQHAAGAVIDAVQGTTGSAPFVIDESHASGRFMGYDPFQGQDRTFTVTLDHATGLAIFYPPRNSTNTASAYMAYVQHRLFDTTRDSGWTRFLAQGIPPQLSGDASPMPNDVLIPPLTLGVQASTAQRIYLPIVVR